MFRKESLLFLAVFSALAAPALGGRSVDGPYWGDDLAYSDLMDSTSGPKAKIYLRTDEVVYLADQDSISLSIDIEPNGHLFEKTFFLYLQNMQTGQLSYINVNDGLLPSGQITDYSGRTLENIEGYPIPSIQDFAIFGDSGQAGAAIPTTAEMVGNHRFVFELRDISGKRIFQRAVWGFAIVDSVEVLPLEFTEDATLTSNKAYVLDNRALFVQTGATVTIEPGVYVLGQGQLSAFTVARGGTLIAEGTEGRPIVFTSASSVGTRFRADWGGLIINGRAPVNVGEGIGEGDTGTYGGNDPADSSGRLRYVRVEFAGIEFSPDNELNGIAFQGVGSGTRIDHIQVHFNLDDGVEFFGGTASAKYVLLTGNADDSLDWTEGWTGKMQFVVLQQVNDDADQGIEADNNAENNELTPRSNPTIYNMTIVGGRPAPGSEEESDIGVLLREGTTATIRNAVVMGMGEQGLVIDQDATVGQAQAGNVHVTNSIFFGNGTSGEQGKTGNFSVGNNVTVNFDINAFMTDPARRNRVGIDPKLREPFNLVSPDFRPMAESPLLDINFVANPPDDGFFEQVYFIGGVGPDHDWTVGWTTHAPN